MDEVAEAAQGNEDRPTFRRAKLTKLAANIEEFGMATWAVERWLACDGAPGIGEATRANALPGRSRDACDLAQQPLIGWACPQGGVGVAHEPDQQIDSEDDRDQHRDSQAQEAADVILVGVPKPAARDPLGRLAAAINVPA